MKNYKKIKKGYFPYNRHCIQCGRTMNPVDYFIGPVCKKCCKDNQRRVAGTKIA